MDDTTLLDNAKAMAREISGTTTHMRYEPVIVPHAKTHDYYARRRKGLAKTPSGRRRAPHRKGG